MRTPIVISTIGQPLKTGQTMEYVKVADVSDVINQVIKNQDGTTSSVKVITRAQLTSVTQRNSDEATEIASAISVLNAV